MANDLAKKRVLSLREEVLTVSKKITELTGGGFLSEEFDTLSSGEDITDLLVVISKLEILLKGAKKYLLELKK